MTAWLLWYWPCWLAGIAITFAIPEGIALWRGGMTFSSFMWSVTQAWGAWPFVWGVLIGGLAVHLWWHWMPPGATSAG